MQGRQELPAREVARRAEDDERRRAGRRLDPKPILEGIRPSARLGTTLSLSKVAAIRLRS